MQVGDPSGKFIPGFPAPRPSGAARKTGAAAAKPLVLPAQTAVGAPQPRAAAKSSGTSELMRVRTLEDAVKLLNDQGRLPPRGSLVDLSA